MYARWRLQQLWSMVLYHSFWLSTGSRAPQAMALISSAEHRPITGRGKAVLYLRAGGG
jgi:hypothetical protein